MASLRDTAARWLADGTSAVLVEVTQALGSAPREAGTRMLVSATQCEGTIGGGHLELKAIERARRLLAAGETVPQSAHYPLGPALGQCCGGAVTLGFSRLDASSVAAWPMAAPRFHLQLYGAGHVGRAIVNLLEGIACRVQWIDERESEFPRAPSAPHVERLCVEPVEAEVALAPPGACYLVLTHSHALDMAITDKRADREKLARERIPVVREKLSWIEVKLDEGADVPDLVITCDGEPVPRGSWGAPMSFDTGDHRVVVSAARRAPIKRKMEEPCTRAISPSTPNTNSTQVA